MRSRLKTYTKQFSSQVEAGDKQAATEAYRVVARELDKAAARGVIHPNKAANNKSRLSKRLQAL